MCGGDDGNQTLGAKRDSRQLVPRGLWDPRGSPYGAPTNQYAILGILIIVVFIRDFFLTSSQDKKEQGKYREYIFHVTG